jgi:hypothetical protein
VLLRIAISLFFTSLAVFATAERLGIGIPIPFEEAVRRELNRTATPEELNARTIAALDRGDVDDAQSFAALAAELNRPLPAATLERLAAEQSPGRVAARTAGDFALGFATGNGEGAAGIAGSVISDFTVIGDLRDLGREGTKMALGEPYSQLILGLSAVGIAATAATVASGGGGAPIKASVSVLKAAFRAGAITAGFAADLGRKLAKAVDFSALDAVVKKLDVTSPRTIAEAPAAIARTVHPEVFAAVASDVAAVQRTVGSADTVKLLRYVNSADDLAELPAFTARFGKASVAVASFTGRASLRVFKTTLRIADFLLDSLLAVLAWFGALLMAMLWGSAKRMLQALIRGTRRRRKRAPQLAPPAAVRVRPASAPDPPPPHLRLRYCLHRAMEVRAEQRARDAAGTRPRPAAG